MRLRSPRNVLQLRWQLSGMVRFRASWSEWTIKAAEIVRCRTGGGVLRQSRQCVADVNQSESRKPNPRPPDPNSRAGGPESQQPDGFHRRTGHRCRSFRRKCRGLPQETGKNVTSTLLLRPRRPSRPRAVGSVRVVTRLQPLEQIVQQLPALRFPENPTVGVVHEKCIMNNLWPMDRDIAA